MEVQEKPTWYFVETVFYLGVLGPVVWNLCLDKTARECENIDTFK